MRWFGSGGIRLVLLGSIVGLVPGGGSAYANFAFGEPTPTPIVNSLDSQLSLASSTGGLFIGCGADQSLSSFWSGLIDDIRIYNRAVTP